MKAKEIAGELGKKKLGFKANTPLHIMGISCIKGEGEDFEKGTDNLATAVTNTVLLIKEEVLPTIRNTTDNVTDELTRRTKEEESSFIPEVVKFSIPECFAARIDNNEIIRRDIKELPRVMVKLPVDLDIYTLLKESPVLNTDELAYISSVPQIVVEEVYQRLLVNVKDLDIYKYANERNHRVKEKDDIFIIELIARTLLNNPPEGTVANLANFNSLMTSIVGIADKIILSLYQRFNSTLDKGILILSSRENPNVVVVNEAVYNDYINSDGDIDVILGLWTKKAGMLRKELAISNAEKHASAWNVYISLKRTELKTRQKKLYELVYQNAFLSSDKEYTYSVENPRKSIEDYLRKASVEDLSNVKDVVKDIVGDIFYPRIGAGDFLRILEKEEFNNLPMKDAIALAVTDFVCKTVLGFVSVEE